MTAAARVQKTEDFNASFYVLLTALAVMIYDTLLTLPKEVELLWTKKFRLAALLYSMSRYAMLIFLVLFLVEDTVPLKPQVCTSLFHFLDSLVYFNLVGNQGLLILRTYAISKRSRLVLAFLTFLLLGSIASAIPSSVLDSCTPTTSQQKEQVIEFNVSTGLSMATDTAVIVITFYYTAGYARLRGKVGGDSWIDLLLKQGLLRYLFVLTITMTHVVCQATLRLSISGVLWPLENALSTLFICRFLLEIRERNHSQNSSSNAAVTSLASFRAVTQQVQNVIMEEFGDPMFSEDSDSSERGQDRDIELMESQEEHKGKMQLASNSSGDNEIRTCVVNDAESVASRS